MNNIVKNPDTRRWLYGIAGAASLILIGYGIITAEQGGLWLALVGAILGAPQGIAAANVPPKE